MRTDFIDVYAIPGQGSIIDGINPETDRTLVLNETQEEVQQRYPLAERMSWESWRQEQITKQQTPITWTPVGQHEYNEMLDVLPPICFTSAGFLVGEPTDHSFTDGRPRFQAYITRHSSHFASDRPLTIKEFQALR